MYVCTIHTILGYDSQFCTNHNYFMTQQCSKVVIIYQFTQHTHNSMSSTTKHTNVSHSSFINYIPTRTRTLEPGRPWLPYYFQKYVLAPHFWGQVAKVEKISQSIYMQKYTYVPPFHMRRHTIIIQHSPPQLLSHSLGVLNPKVLAILLGGTYIIAPF